MNFSLRRASGCVVFAGCCASCAPSPPPPPVKLPRGGEIQWNGTIGFWDRNGDGKPDRLRQYFGSGYAREYFDDDFDGIWDGAEHAPNHKPATGLKEKRIPEGLGEQDRKDIASALEHCVSG
jgi:hypothetical protein